MAAQAAAVWNGYVGALGRLAGVAHRHQTYVVSAVTLLMSFTLIYQRQIEAAGVTWWTQSWVYQVFVWGLALSVMGSDPFTRGRTGGAKRSPASA